MQYFGKRYGHLLSVIVMIYTVVFFSMTTPSDPHLCLVPYFSHLSVLTYWIHHDGITLNALLWTYFDTDYNVAKWKRRRKEDLHGRRSHVTKFRLRDSSTPHQPLSSMDWDGLPPMDYDVMLHSMLLSSSYDFHCTQCSDFLDILTFDPIPDDGSTFCGLLDHTSIGVYIFDSSNEALVFDTGASVSISNSLSMIL